MEEKHKINEELKRIEMFRGSWDFSQTTNSLCKAVKTVQFDPKKMPLWLVNPMVNKFLIKELENTRTLSAK